MDFKKILSISLIFAGLMGLMACSEVPVDGTSKDENKIGTPVTAMSTLNKADGTDRNQVFIFDELVRKIHLFEATDLKFVRSFNVQNSGEKHYLISQDEGNYLVDLSLKRISVFDKYGKENKEPIALQGDLISTAYRSDLGLLVVYDKNSNIGAMQISSTGDVLKRWVGASVNGKGVSAGDILSNGNLVLALDDDSLCVMDLLQTITGGGNWVVNTSPFATGLVGINWVAPLPEDANLVLVHSNDKLNKSQKLSLINLTTHSVVSEDLSQWHLEKYSKTKNPHVLLRNPSWNWNSGELKIMYVENAQIKSRVLYNRKDRIMISDLDLQKDEWSIVDSSKTTVEVYNEINEIKESRNLTRYKFGSGVAINSMALPSTAQLQLGQSFVFALYPNKVGYAVRHDISSGETKEARFFNLNSL